MQSNPVLTLLKILAFAVLAFVVGMSSCQQTDTQDKIELLRDDVSTLTRKLEDMSRKIEAGGFGSHPPGNGTVPGSRSTAPRPPRASDIPDRAVLDGDLDPSRPLGTLGRYRDMLSVDPDPEVPVEAVSAGKMNGEISWHMGPQPKGFNFITENDAGTTNFIQEYVAGSPANRHWANPSEYAPSICWRVEASPDFQEYTLFFRKDAIWHTPVADLRKYPHLDGRHMVTAKDYKFTLDIILNPQTDCASLRGYYSDVTEVKLIDDHTVVVRWGKPLFHSVSFTLGAVVMPEFLFAFGEDGKRFPEASIGQSFNDHWYNSLGFCGCGPYRFVSHEAGQRIVLERFEDWWGIKEGIRYPLRTHSALIFPDPVTSFLKIKSGDINVGGLTSAQWKEAILDNKDPKSPFNDGSIEHWIGSSPNYFYFGWKNRHTLFRDKVVRKALTLACNREQICRDIFLDRYKPMAAPVFPDSADADPALKPLPFDLAEARRLLDSAGWLLDPGTGLRTKTVDGAKKTFEFTLLYPGPNADFEAATNQYKNDLLSIGIRMEPRSIEWAAYLKKLQDRDFDACALSWATSGWEHDFDQIWHSRQIQETGSSNHVEYSNPEVDRLSDALRGELDRTKRTQMIRRIGAILYEDQPYCFFGWQNVFNVNRSYMKNVKEHQYKMRPFRRAYPIWDAR